MWWARFVPRISAVGLFNLCFGWDGAWLKLSGGCLFEFIALNCRDFSSQEKKGDQSKKKVSQRGKDFSKEEDRIICSTFLNVSKDRLFPFNRTNQSSGGYYQSMHDYFAENIVPPTTRSVVAIQHRWLSIQKAVNKFCGFHSVIQRENESGKTEQNRIDDAIKLYEDSEPWTFMHCWTILQHEAKWNDKMTEINTVGNATRVNQRVANNSPDQLDENGELAHPEGRDTAKKRRARPAVDTSASSAAIEVLQRMNERGQIKDDKEDSQMAQILQRKDAKIELQHNMIALQREEMEKRWELEKERLILTREEVEMRKEQTKVELLKAEAHFMGEDLDKLAPHLKEYYISIQQELTI
ncbi:hypothetical protein U9M48_032280, partial [Paspalum notatum var. saurae]